MEWVRVVGIEVRLGMSLREHLYLDSSVNDVITIDSMSSTAGECFGGGRFQQLDVAVEDVCAKHSETDNITSLLACSS